MDIFQCQRKGFGSKLVTITQGQQLQPGSHCDAARVAKKMLPPVNERISMVCVHSLGWWRNLVDSSFRTPLFRGDVRSDGHGEMRWTAVLIVLFLNLCACVFRRNTRGREIRGPDEAMQCALLQKKMRRK